MDSLITWTPGVSLASIEKQVILAAFRFYRGNKTTTSTALGISIRTLDNKLEKYEADGKADKEKEQTHARKQSDYLARARGNLGGTSSSNAAASKAVGDDTAHGNKAHEGVRVEPAVVAPAQQAMPMPQRKEVQAMPSNIIAKSNPRSAR